MNMTWLTNALGRTIGFLPDLVAGLVILLVGYAIARVLSAVVRTLLSRTRFDGALARHGLLARAPEEHTGSRWVASAAFWLVIVAACMQAARAWRLDFVGAGLARVLAYVPHLVAAALIIGFAVAIANWVGRVMNPVATREKATGEPLTRRGIAAGAVRAGIIALGVFMALQELQIAAVIVTIAFAFTMGAIAVAAALAFGLGSRDVAHDVARRWYEKRASGNGHAGIPTPREPPSTSSDYREPPPLSRL
jgi:hypothetical protein